MTTSPPLQTETPPPRSLHNLPQGLSPDSIDTLPVLSTLISRLQVPQTSNPGASTAGSPPTGTATSPSQLASGTGPLLIKDIPAATDELKHKLQKARVKIKELPDLERTVEEQEEEIKMLEERISAQRKVLKGLASRNGEGNGTVRTSAEGDQMES